jgi:hypothetical protein
MPDALPPELLDQRLAIVGKTGSGKSFTACGAVECLLDRGDRVAIVDPTGAWWGLRSSADGAQPGFPVVVFGGEHADVDLLETMGAPLARLIASGKVDACVIDVSGLGTHAALRRFATALLETLYAENREPLHLIVDEADIFAPQRPQRDGLRLLGSMEEIVRRGRKRGFVPWLITQRPAVVHKDVLSQADVMVAMKLTLAHDRDAIGRWIEGQADREQGKRILGDLPTLPLGTGYVWAPGDGILERMAFPRIRSFDSFATPKRGDRAAAPRTLAEVDLTAITAALEADDDEHSAKRGKSKSAPIVADPAAIDAARAEGYRDGMIEGARVQRATDAEKMHAMEKAMQAALGYLAPYVRTEADGTRIIDVREPSVLTIEADLGAAPIGRPVPDRASGNGAAPPRQRRPVQVAPSGAGDLNSAARKLLTASVQHAPAKFTWGQLATIAGLKPSGGHFNTGRKQLLDAALVDDPGDLVRPTAAGVAVIGETPPAPSSAAERLAMWCSRLPSPAPDMLRALVRHGPRFIDPADLAAELGKEPRGGHWNTGVSILKANLLVELQGRSMRAASLLRP